jgi:hypothetical protein
MERKSIKTTSLLVTLTLPESKQLVQEIFSTKKCFDASWICKELIFRHEEVCSFNWLGHTVKQI